MQTKQQQDAVRWTARRLDKVAKRFDSDAQVFPMYHMVTGEFMQYRMTLASEPFAFWDLDGRGGKDTQDQIEMILTGGPQE